MKHIIIINRKFQHSLFCEVNSFSEYDVIEGISILTKIDKQNIEKIDESSTSKYLDVFGIKEMTPFISSFEYHTHDFVNKYSYTIKIFKAIDV